ncbi:MAG: hypothetical protein WCT07_00730 [Candidatus Paceibacterota bacterium]|jgi:hypothetical protein
MVAYIKVLRIMNNKKGDAVSIALFIILVAGTGIGHKSASLRSKQIRDPVFDS